MNPYKEIARLHLTEEDLLQLLAEKRKEPETLTEREKRIEAIRWRFENR